MTANLMRAVLDSEQNWPQPDLKAALADASVVSWRVEFEWACRLTLTVETGRQTDLETFRLLSEVLAVLRGSFQFAATSFGTKALGRDVTNTFEFTGRKIV